MKTKYSKNQNILSSVLSKMDVGILLLFFITLCSTTITAQGNNCGGATSLTVNGACASGDNINDNNSTNPNIGVCAGSGSFQREGWYTFTVTGAATNITITAVSGNRNLFLQLISETTNCTGLTQIACANADTNNNSAQTETITQLLNAGTYYVKVVNVGSSNNNMTLTSLCITSPPCTTPTTQPTSLVLSPITSTSISGSFTAASPAPSGYLVVRSTSAVAPTPVNGTAYTVGSTVGGYTVVSASNATTFTSTGLTSNTKYYYYIFSYNDACAGAPYYQVVSPLTGNATTCPAAPTAAVNSAITGNSFTISWTASVAGGGAGTINYTLEVYTDAGYTVPIAGSPFAVGTAITYPLSGLNASTTYYYRIKANNGSCDSTYLTNTAQTNCATPAAQPTVLSLNTITSTSINGSFTAASPAPSGYLIVRSSSATPPTLTNGTTYAVGITTLTPGTTRVIQGSAITSNAVTFSDTGLTSNTLYYYHIFSYNTGCTGAPSYLASSPLTGNATTCPAAPTAAVNSGITTSDFTVSWTASVNGGGAGIINYTLEVYTDAGYTTSITGSPFAVGTAVTYAVTGLNASTTYYYRIKANNGSCDSTYLTNTVQTTCATPLAQPTTLILNTLTSTSMNGSFTAASPAPSGYLIVRSSSATPPTLTNGTTYAVGITTLTPGTTRVIQGSAITSNAVTFSDTGLTSNTRYYYHIFSYNSNCTGTPYYLTASPLTNNAITCPAAPTAPVNSAVSSTGFTVSWTASAAGGAAATINYILEVYTDAAYTTPIAGSPFSVGTAVTYPVTGLTAATLYYYRIKANNGSCDSTYLTSNVTTGCAIPAAQPTTLTLSTITSTSINGSFTAASPAPSGYLIVRSSSATPPTLTNGTTYAVGITTLTPGTTRVIQGSAITSNAVTFSDTGLTSNTKYYYHIFSYNTGCSGAPNYLTVSPLTNNATTCPAAPTVAVNSAISSSGFTVSWTASVVGGGAAAINYTLYVYTDAGYTTQIAGSPFSVGTAVTSPVTGLSPTTTYYYRIKANNGSCDSAYLTGSATTSVANDECSTAIAITPTTTCTYTTYTNAGATNSTGIPAPGCAHYLGGDVWFSVVVPSTGIITINTQAGVLTDGGMAVYSGTCGALTLIQCDDDSGAGNMPYLTLTGLTSGNTVWIRVWEYDNNNNGTFELCVTTPIPCTAGNGTGTTTLACPSVISGGLGLNGVAPQAVNCYAPTTCVDLEATFPQYNQTTTYSVSSIPYAPPYQYTCLANPVSVNVDDVWSSTITLPFNFCFYGNNYNQCLIGSNGTITFDTTSNTPGGFSTWSFTNNLPNNTLFLNTIFGAYHDIDPSKGGKVGWELITLNTGCRALVAAWNDIPMYAPLAAPACNSILYTGMIVLYENTNVIEVYMKNKTACNTWNDGNAVVGVQNANGTQAVVAPNRNSLDANWTVTNEAWRFTPAGASLTSIKWYQGAGTTGPVVGTTSTLNVCPSSTTVYTAEVSYALCNGTTLKEVGQTTVTITTSKTWTGNVNTDWSNANNWNPSGVPTNADCIIIPNVTNDPIISGSNYHAYGYNLTVQNGGNLQINSSDNTLTITDAVKVNAGGVFTIKNAASLIQINNAAVNTGSITMERTANMTRYDYVYWSSPVAGFNSGAISPGSPAGYLFKWSPTYANPNGSQGYWVSGTETMTAGLGYICMGPNSFSSSTSAPFTATFSGVPFNGIVQPPIARGSYTGADFAGTNGFIITNLDDNWNLLGNPYPSAIDALGFLALNPSLNGNVRLWTHGSSISSSNANPFYGSYTYNYNANDYVSYNGTGSTPPGFNGKIGAGQSFFVIMNDGTATTSTATFNNSLRSENYSNSQFYKSGSTNTLENMEQNRIWLSLVNANNIAATTLIGYVSGATFGEDRLFDASHKPTAELGLYSLINDKPAIIQGRPVPFDDNDYVLLGTTIPTNGTYTIAINKVDGLFENAGQNIYLEDTYNQVDHDLRQSPYTFTANQGNYIDRFILKYKTATLGNPSHQATDAFAYINNHTIKVQATENIKEIVIHDVTGKLIATYKPEGNRFEEHFPFANGVYLATITLENNTIVSKKLLN